MENKSVEIHPASLRSLVIVIGENAEMTSNIHGYSGALSAPPEVIGPSIHIHVLQDKASHKKICGLYS